MKLFSAILGVLSIFGGVYCVLWPELAFLNAGWIVALVTFLWGVCAIITYVIDKKIYHENDGDGVSGFLGLAFGVGALVLSVMATANEIIEAVFLVLVLILLMAFLALMGCKNIVDALQIKHSRKRKGWIVGFVFGVAQVLLALVGLVQWFFAVGGDDFTRVLIGLILGAFGVTLIAMSFAREKIDRWSKL